jgi:putative MATE family efflux protein
MEWEMNDQRLDEHILMTQTPITSLVARQALPTIVSQLVTSMYNMADTYFVAHISQSAAAAIGVVFSLMSLIQAIGMGIGTGVGSIVARRLGAQQDEQADMTASSGVLLALIFALALMITGLLFLEPMVRIMGSTESMLPYSLSYAKYVLVGAPVLCVSFVYNNTLRYQGKAHIATIGLCSGAVLNVFLDPLLITTAGLGISGAAIATVAGQVVSLLVLMYPFKTGLSIVKISPKLLSRSLGDYILILRTGLPAACRQGLACFASSLLNYNAKTYGDAAVAAITIANKIYLVVRSVVLGIGQGFQPAVVLQAGDILCPRPADTQLKFPAARPPDVTGSGRYSYVPIQHTISCVPVSPAAEVAARIPGTAMCG